MTTDTYHAAMNQDPDLGDPSLARLREFQPSTEAIATLSERITAQVHERLSGRASSLKVLETFAGLPSGEERGLALVVDWGGTNGRAALLELEDQGRAAVRAQRQVVFSEADKTGPLDTVLGKLAECVRAVVPESGILPLSFIYSFPAQLTALDRAIALPLTKGWNPAGLEGADVVAAFRTALAKAGLSRVRVVAVANDTVAPLLLSTWRSRCHSTDSAPSDLGMILGTGTNLAANLGVHGIRNLESGNFDRVESVASRFDDELDAEIAEPNPGAQRLEKMISGQYLGELMRRALGSDAKEWPTPFSLPTRLLSEWVDADLDSDRVQLAKAIGRRSAQLAAATVLGAVRVTDPGFVRTHRVAVDGSLYGKFPGYRAWMAEALQDLAEAATVEVVFENESTQAGAAVLALWTFAKHKGK